MELIGYNYTIETLQQKGVSMKASVVTGKMYERTRDNIKLLAAHRKQKMYEVLDEVVSIALQKELVKTQSEEKGER
jgi:hypothetical protein